MAIEWLAGNRLRGTSTERTSTSGFNPTTAVEGGWKELGRTTLGSASSTITVSSLPDKRYYKVLTHITGQASNSDVSIRLNGDTGSNYARRFSTNGGSDIAGTVTSLPYHYTDVAKTTPIFAMAYLANKSDKEKLSISHGVRQTGTTSGAPSRFESVGKWANTSNAINEIQVLGSTNFNSGSECVVLGWDPDDTHTSNFWEELASVTNSGGSTNNFNTGAFTAKKYLWVQAYVVADGLVEPRIRVGTGGSIDTGTNIASRTSSNGGADGTATSRDDMVVTISSLSVNHYINMFMINNTSNEKLAIHNSVNESTVGAATAPQRREGVSKYANTSAQVNILEIEDNAVSTGIADGTIIKVWGSD